MIKKICLLIVLTYAFTLKAQIAGTITLTTVTTGITVVSPTTAISSSTDITCTFTPDIIGTATKINIECKQAGVSLLSLSSWIPKIGSTSGVLGSINADNNAITWLLKKTSTSISYSITANGTNGSGSF